VFFGCIALCEEILSIHSCIYLPLGICNSSLEKFLFTLLTHSFIESFENLVSWFPYKFEILIHCQLCSWWRCFFILLTVSSVRWPFPLLCKWFLGRCSTPWSTLSALELYFWYNYTTVILYKITTVILKITVLGSYFV
jgi:hypothetical protein